MKLSIITALHERYRLTRLFLGYYQELVVPGVTLDLFCAVSYGDERMEAILSDYPAWTQVRANNMPLPKKFGACLLPVIERSTDAVMILGSDDFVDARYVQRSLEALSYSGFVGTKTIEYLELGTDQMIRQTTPADAPIGAGRSVSVGLLRDLNWQLWDDDAEGLDNAMMQRMKLHGVHAHVIEGGALLDVKSDICQTAYRTVRKWPHTQIDAHAYLDKHFPTLKQPLLNW